MMWESPIDVIYDDMQTKLENEVLKATQAVGIKVDRDELIKALEYDRNQYEKGYEDGQRDAVKEGHWTKLLTSIGEYFECSECGEIVSDAVMGQPRFKFCPMCGCKMKEAENE